MFKSRFTKKLDRNSYGFTLLELLVAFSVMAVITGFGMTSFVSISRRQTIYEAATNMKQAVDQARFNAISVVKPDACSGGELTSYTVSFCYNGNSSCPLADNLYSVNAICTNTTAVLISSVDLPSNVAFEAPVSGMPCQDVAFHSVQTRVTGTPCSVVIAGYGETVTVTLDSQGYVSFE